MRTTTQHTFPQGAKKALLFLLALAVIAAALATVWLTAIPETVPAISWQNQQPVAVLSAGLTDLAQDKPTQQALLDALPVTVQSAGCDTLYYTANSVSGIGWEDRRCTIDPKLRHPAAMGLVDRTFDALDYLADACANAGVRLVAVVDVQALAGDVLIDNALADDAFTTRLQSVVANLAGEYALSALVLRLPDAVSDSAVNRAVLSGIARQCSLPLGLELAAHHPLLRTADTGVDMLVACVASADDAETAVYLRDTGIPVLWLARDAVSFSSAAYYAAGQGLAVESCVWASAKTAATQPAMLQGLRASVQALEGAPAVTLPQTPQTLAVSYPEQNATLYTENVFLMGTSDPAQPLTINGGTVNRSTKNGMFGILLPLKVGSNTFTLTQGDDTIEVNVARAQGGTGGGSYPRDDTPYLYEGTRIRITSWITSVLADPDDENRITETAKAGGVAVVNRCATTVRNGRKTYAYELVSGGWVTAANCEVVTDNIGPWPLSNLAIVDDGRNETITLVSGGQALGYDSWDEEAGVLTVTLANTTLETEETRALASAFCGSVQLQPAPGGVRLTFAVNGERQLWGYDVTYDDAGNTVLTLKGAPQLDLEAAQPLKGAVVMLDPGHGQNDTGAAGVAGALGGPAEKDLNLALALAIRTRLQQLGATVVMTRQDDTFLSLEERSRLAKQTQPDLFLAVHHNSVELVSDANHISGASAYYFTLQGKQLADAMLPRVADAAYRKNSGSSWSYFYVTRMTYTPAVLFEYGFVVNPVEYEACSDPLTILRQGDATAMGILDWFRARIQ